ncbi:MAG TPA: hypothetical protein VD969_07250 [Symbiobacteriaceae bacterium]|nr:hypothetical protein [Symbiobacteriaceae bacterium]
MKGWLLKFLYYALPTLAMAVIVLSMNTGPVLKRPLGSHDDLPAQLEQVAALALSGRWEEAGRAEMRLAQTWARVKGRVSFTSTTDEIEIFDLLLAELQAAVDGRDHLLVRSAHLRLKSLWEDLGS